MILVVVTGLAIRLLDLEGMENLLVGTLVLAIPLGLLAESIKQPLKQEKQ